MSIAGHRIALVLWMAHADSSVRLQTRGEAGAAGAVNHLRVAVHRAAAAEKERQRETARDRDRERQRQRDRDRDRQTSKQTNRQTHTFTTERACLSSMAGASIGSLWEQTLVLFKKNLLVKRRMRRQTMFEVWATGSQIVRVPFCKMDSSPPPVLCSCMAADALSSVHDGCCLPHQPRC